MDLEQGDRVTPASSPSPYCQNRAVKQKTQLQALAARKDLACRVYDLQGTIHYLIKYLHELKDSRDALEDYI